MVCLLKLNINISQGKPTEKEELKLSGKESCVSLVATQSGAHHGKRSNIHPNGPVDVLFSIQIYTYLFFQKLVTPS